MASIRVTLDGGPYPAFSSVSRDLADRVRGLRPGVFTCESSSLDPGDHLIIWPAPFDTGDNYPHHRVSLRGTLPEWSLDSLGWLAAMLSDVITRQGMTAPLMFSAENMTVPSPSSAGSTPASPGPWRLT